MTQNLTSAQIQKAVIAARNGVAPPDGPILLVFEPKSLASAIERECHRIEGCEGQRISINMDPIDARLLVKFLRGEL
jgi:hypothetical protein